METIYGYEKKAIKKYIKHNMYFIELQKSSESIAYERAINEIIENLYNYIIQELIEFSFNSKRHIFDMNRIYMNMEYFIKTY